MDAGTQKQIDYLDKLLTSLRTRYFAGDKSVEQQIRITAAKLEQLKIQSQPAPKVTVVDLAKAMVKKVTQRCCRR
jgi:hypothetical protein